MNVHYHGIEEAVKRVEIFHYGESEEFATVNITTEHDDLALFFAHPEQIREFCVKLLEELEVKTLRATSDKTTERR